MPNQPIVTVRALPSVIDDFQIPPLPNSIRFEPAENPYPRECGITTECFGRRNRSTFLHQEAAEQLQSTHYLTVCTLGLVLASHAGVPAYRRDSLPLFRSD